MNCVKTLENKASTDLSAYLGYCVEFDTSGMDVCDAITDKVTGVITKGGATNSDVCIFGECLAKCGGTVLQGQPITSHTDGTIVPTAASSQDFGFALEDGKSGDFINIWVIGVSKTNS